MNSVLHAHTIRKPVMHHIHELRLRLVWIVLAIVACSGLAYGFNHELINFLQAPLDQKLYYTAPTGGFSFVFKMCAVAGIIAALPVVVYHFFAFLAPLIKHRKRGFIAGYTVWSFSLAYLGIAFAYFISLPAALHFLIGFGGTGIDSLISADAYFNFVLAYLGGFAGLFQLPLIILFINRITPLTPRRMMSAQRYIIVGSFIVAAILTPTPDPLNQSLMALPIIVLYQVSIGLIWLKSRKRRPQAVPESIVIKPQAETVTEPAPTEQLAPVNTIKPRRRQYMDIKTVAISEA